MAGGVLLIGVLVLAVGMGLFLYATVGDGSLSLLLEPAELDAGHPSCAFQLNCRRDSVPVLGVVAPST
jgi:hypothetical protein